MYKLIKQKILLSNKAMDRLLALLKNPPPPNKALLKAYKEYIANKQE
jgi:uncharacterized protein (DUF1778 family)